MKTFIFLVSFLSLSAFAQSPKSVQCTSSKDLPHAYVSFWTAKTDTEVVGTLQVKITWLLESHQNTYHKVRLVQLTETRWFGDYADGDLSFDWEDGETAAFPGHLTYFDGWDVLVLDLTCQNTKME